MTEAYFLGAVVGLIINIAVQFPFWRYLLVYHKLGGSKEKYYENKVAMDVSIVLLSLVTYAVLWLTTLVHPIITAIAFLFVVIQAIILYSKWNANEVLPSPIGRSGSGQYQKRSQSEIRIPVSVSLTDSELKEIREPRMGNLDTSETRNTIEVGESKGGGQRSAEYEVRRQYELEKAIENYMCISSMMSIEAIDIAIGRLRDWLASANRDDRSAQYEYKIRMLKSLRRLRDSGDVTQVPYSHYRNRISKSFVCTSAVKRHRRATQEYEEYRKSYSLHLHEWGLLGRKERRALKSTRPSPPIVPSPLTQFNKNEEHNNRVEYLVDCSTRLIIDIRGEELETISDSRIELAIKRVCG